MSKSIHNLPRGRIRYTKMLTTYRMAARISIFSLLLAVFFSRATFAVDPPLTSLESGMTDLVYDLSRSIVTIESFHRTTIVTGPDGGGETVQSLVSTGIVCDSSGTILALAPDVVGQDKILVEFEGRSYPAQVVAVDYYTDLALINIGRKVGEPVRFTEKQVCAGQMIVAMGNAYGLRASPVIGFCAGLRPDGTMQFSVPVASSSLGGGIFDLSGHLIGVMTGGLGQDSRVALAVPGYQIPSIVAYLRTHGDRQAGYIGVTTTEIEITPPLEISSPMVLAAAGAANHNTIDQGILVTTVVTGSPADVSGIQKGDLILAVNNRRLASALQLSSEVRQARPGTVFDISFIRRNSLESARVEVGSRSYYRLKPQLEAAPVTDGISPKVDSLTQLLDYLKSEVGRLEDRMKRLK